MGLNVYTCSCQNLLEVIIDLFVLHIWIILSFLPFVLTRFYIALLEKLSNEQTLLRLLVDKLNACTALLNGCVHEISTLISSSFINLTLPLFGTDSVILGSVFVILAFQFCQPN